MSESVFENLINDQQQQQQQSFDDIRNWYYTKAIAMKNDLNINLRDADIRFSSALNMRKVKNTSVCIVGAGGLGNWQWRILMSMGFERISIYDDDKVGIENIGPQCHSIFDIDRFKVDAVYDAAVQYRGIGITRFYHKVNDWDFVVDDLGYCPDIFIGCTDSAEFRNSIIDRFYYAIRRDTINSHNNYPELFLDFRMSLGDWICYCIPVREIIRTGAYALMEKYKDEAMFEEEDAVHEPCTARAIAYTGANAASFTGAYLHWYLQEGKEFLLQTNSLPNYFDMANSSKIIPCKFYWKTSFSARDFEFITQTANERKLRQKISNEKEKFTGLEIYISDQYKLTDFSMDKLCEYYVDDETALYCMLHSDGKVLVCLKHSCAYLLVVDDTDNTITCVPIYRENRMSTIMQYDIAHTIVIKTTDDIVANFYNVVNNERSPLFVLEPTALDTDSVADLNAIYNSIKPQSVQDEQGAQDNQYNTPITSLYAGSIIMSPASEYECIVKETAPRIKLEELTEGGETFILPNSITRVKLCGVGNG